MLKKQIFENKYDNFMLKTMFLFCFVKLKRCVELKLMLFFKVENITLTL
jgi:hypothetical protein